MQSIEPVGNPVAVSDLAVPVQIEPGSGLSYRRGVVMVVSAGLVWSTMGLGIRLMEVANVWQILFYRSLAMAPFLFFIIAVRSRGAPFPVIRRAGLAGIVGGIGLVAAFSGGIYAIQQTTVANAMFLFASSPLFAALLGRLILREPVRGATWIAMSIAACGIGLMVANGISLGRTEGNLAALASAFGFASFTIALRWRKLGDMLPAVFISGIMAVITAGVICAAAGHTLAIPLHDIAIASAMGIFQLGAGLTLYTFGSKSLPAAELALLSLTEVLLGPLWVWIFLGETVTILTLAGGGILLAALAFNALSGMRRKPAPIVL